MKRFISAIVISLICWQGVKSGEPIEYGLFNHLGIGASIGTDGYGFDVSTCISRWAGLRVGISKLPDYRYSTSIEVEIETQMLKSKEIEMEAKLNSDVNYKVLLDFYPFKKSSFHLTGGAFFGTRNLVSVYNKEPFLDEREWERTGIRVGDYRITTDDHGIIRANLETNAIKPYVGLGFGRAVPKRRVNFAFDLGVRYWGEPGIYMTTKDKWGDSEYTRLTKEGINDKDFDKAFDVMSKIVAYPVLTLRLSGRIF